MTTPTNSRFDLLTVIVSMRSKAGKEQDLREALKVLIEPTKQEAGCVDYHWHQGISDPAVFYFYENWESIEHHDAHMRAPHMQEIIGRVEELLDNAPTIERLRRIG